MDNTAKTLWPKPKSNPHIIMSLPSFNHLNLPGQKREKIHSDFDNISLSSSSSFQIKAKYSKFQSYDQKSTNSSTLLKQKKMQKSNDYLKPFSCSSLITYKVKGSLVSSFSSQNSMDIQKTTLEKLFMKHKNKDSENLSESDFSDDSSGLMPSKKYENSMRYYSQSLNERNYELTCLNCKRKGHKQECCPILKCLFCFGCHKQQACEDVICLKCTGHGHSPKSCPLQGKSCEKCSKLGHTKQKCGSIKFLTEKIDFEKRVQGEGTKKIKCLYCQNESCGNFNCFQYQKQIPNIYGG